MFKLLHLPYGNQILFVAMTIEALVFLVAALEKPGNEYHWEEVFPVLKSKNPMDRPDFAGQGRSILNSPDNLEDDSTTGALNINLLDAPSAKKLVGLDLDLSNQATKSLSDSISYFSGSSDPISKMA